jgi:hypothetical protein
MTETTLATTRTGNATGITTPEQAAPAACCGGPAPVGTDACCAHDADVKTAGGTGCGCGSTAAAPAAKKSACCG